LTSIRHLLSSKFFRYLISGSILFVIDVTVFLICRKAFEIEVFWSELFARTAGASVGFVLHKFFTFTNTSSAMDGKKQGAGYLATVGCNLAFAPFLVSWLVGVVHPYELMGKIMGSVLLAFETFIIYRYIFRESKTPALQSVGQS
jgi:putative flippase GtrA